MGEKDVPIIRPKRTWDKEQWNHYNRMPWVARRLADLMVLVPGFSSWLMRRASRLEEKPPKRIDRKGPRDMINERTSRTGSMGKAAKIGLCVLIGIVWRGNPVERYSHRIGRPRLDGIRSARDVPKAD